MAGLRIGGLCIGAASNHHALGHGTGHIAIRKEGERGTYNSKRHASKKKDSIKRVLIVSHYINHGYSHYPHVFVNLSSPSKPLGEIRLAHKHHPEANPQRANGGPTTHII